MAENSKIEWTDHTLNPWVGCARISPACDFCYAASWAKRTGQAALWEGDRRRTSAANWKQAAKWNREAERTGYHPWVFCASLADVFDNEVPSEWRRDLWRLIAATPNLRWQLLTKRIGNAEKMLPPDWRFQTYAHVGFMATIANQEEADRDLGKLTDLKRRHKVAWIGISYEPALGPLLLQHRELIGGKVRNWLGEGGLDWVVAGGESGPKARAADPTWFRDLRDQCVEAGTPFLFKQHGEWIGVQDLRQLPGGQGPGFGTYDHCRYDQELEVLRVGKKASGRLLDGREWNEMPTVAA